MVMALAFSVIALVVSIKAFARADETQDKLLGLNMKLMFMLDILQDMNSALKRKRKRNGKKPGPKPGSKRKKRGPGRPRKEDK